MIENEAVPLSLDIGTASFVYMIINYSCTMWLIRLFPTGWHWRFRIRRTELPNRILHQVFRIS